MFNHKNEQSDTQTCKIFEFRTVDIQKLVPEIFFCLFLFGRRLYSDTDLKGMSF